MLPSFFSEMKKLADDKKKSPAKDIAKIVGSSALGMGAGTAGGFLTGYGLNALAKKVSGQDIPRAALHGAIPILGGVLGMAYGVHKAREQEAIQRALRDS